MIRPSQTQTNVTPNAINYDKLIKFNSLKENFINVNKKPVNSISSFHVQELDGEALEDERTNEHVGSRIYFAFNSTPNVISQNLINSINNNMFSPNQDESSLDETMFNSPGTYFDYAINWVDLKLEFYI